MAISRSNSETGKYVCAECIGDDVIKAEIQSVRKRRHCSYCNRRRLGVAIEQLAERVDNPYRIFVHEGEAEPVIEEGSDDVDWRVQGSTPSEILVEMLDCSHDDIAQDIVGVLSERNRYAVIKDGDWDSYDDTSDVYEIAIPPDPQFKETWTSFCYSIKHNRRFFNSEAVELLDEIIQPVVKGEWPPGSPAVRLIAPSEEERFIYRARLGNSAAARDAIYATPIRSLGVAPPKLNNSGRMNSAGIPVFYGSFDIKTCGAELRAPVGGTAVVGKFEIVKPLRVLDLTMLDSIRSNISYFSDDAIRQFAYAKFLRGFHSEIKKPIIPGSETLDYLPTQFVAEYLWSRSDPPFDGVIYGSAQISGDKKNIALFPHASNTEGSREEKPRTVKSGRMVTNEEDEGEETIFVSPLVETEGNSYSNDQNVVWPPALRLITDQIKIVDVKAIDYDLNERHLFFVYEENGRDDGLDF